MLLSVSHPHEHHQWNRPSYSVTMRCRSLMVVSFDAISVADVLLHDAQRGEVMAARADEHFAVVGGVHEPVRHQGAGCLEGCDANIMVRSQ